MASSLRATLSLYTVPVLTLLLLVAISTGIIVITCSTHYLTGYGSLSPISHTILVTGVTIFATIISTLVSQQLRDLMLRKIDVSLHRAISCQETWNIADQEFTDVDRDCRSIIGIDKLSEKIRNAVIGFMYLAATLLTASIVATVTPTPSIRSIPYEPLIPDANYHESCVYMVDDINFSDPRPYSWNLEMAAPSSYL